MEDYITNLEDEIKQLKNDIEESKNTIDRYTRSVKHLEAKMEEQAHDLIYLNRLAEEYQGWKSKEVTLGLLHGDQGSIFVTSPDLVTVGDFKGYPEMKIVPSLRLSSGGSSRYLWRNKFVTVVHPPRRTLKYKSGQHQVTLWVREWVVLGDMEVPTRRGYQGCHCPNLILRVIVDSQDKDSFFYTGWGRRECYIKRRSGNELVARFNNSDDYNIVLIDH